jgi:hypothetical protein
VVAVKTSQVVVADPSQNSKIIAMATPTGSHLTDKFAASGEEQHPIILREIDKSVEGYFEVRQATSKSTGYLY